MLSRIKAWLRAPLVPRDPNAIDVDTVRRVLALKSPTGARLAMFGVLLADKRQGNAKPLTVEEVAAEVPGYARRTVVFYLANLAEERVVQRCRGKRKVDRYKYRPLI